MKINGKETNKGKGFSSENQPTSEQKKAGWQKKKALDQIKDEIIEKTKKLINVLPKYRPQQVFLLNNFRNDVNFYKDTYGGMYSSKMYFNINDNIKNIDDLVKSLQNKGWSSY